jgi:hypothetical protein
MRRFLLTLLVAAAVPAAVGTPAGAARATRKPAVPGASANPASRAHLTTNVCQKALDPGQRTVATTAVMKSMPGTVKLQMRFELMTEAGDATTFTPLRGGDLGTWISPQQVTLGQRPGDVWKLNKPVVDVPAPASYRFQVTFRWVGAHAHVLATLTRNGPTCYQPELRPDLQVQGVTVTPDTKGTHDTYAVAVYNGGLTAAGPFVVDFSYTDPSTQAPVVAVHNVSGVRSHQTVKLDWDGPVCKPSAPPTIDIDPAGQVGDYNTSNNTYTIVCPA